MAGRIGNNMIQRLTIGGDSLLDNPLEMEGFESTIDRSQPNASALLPQFKVQLLGANFLGSAL